MKTIVNAFGHKEQIKKFSKGRNNIKDLYPSEKKFFIDIAKKSKTYRIWQKFAENSRIFLEFCKNLQKFSDKIQKSVENFIYDLQEAPKPRF